MTNKLAEVIALNSFTDSRGALKKILRISQLEQAQIEEVYLLYSHPGSVRGNHYHKHTREYFFVVCGAASFSLQDMETGREERFSIAAAEDVVVLVPPGIVHAIKNETDQTIIILAASTREYNALDPDTFPVVIEG